MQFRNIFLLLLTVFFLFNIEAVIAQKITTNENGDKIILYPDGSWRYFDSRIDTKTEPETATSEIDKDQLISFLYFQEAADIHEQSEYCFLDH